MKNKILIWGGLLMVVGFFYGHFGILNNTDNDSLWKWRRYTLVEKHPGAHEYKGKIVEDHYVTVKYSGQETLWVREVTGVKYYSMVVGNTYDERAPRDEKLLNRLNIALIFVGLIGVVMMSAGLANLME